MSYLWGVITKDKHTLLMYSIWYGVAGVFLIGVPLLLLLNHYEVKIPVWFAIPFVIIVFSVSAFSLYHIGSKKIEKEK
jgi:hypothetical protein